MSERGEPVSHFALNWIPLIRIANQRVLDAVPLTLKTDNLSSPRVVDPGTSASVLTKVEILALEFSSKFRFLAFNFS